MNSSDFEAGDRFLPKELPPNQMSPDGHLEVVGDNLIALQLDDGTLVEFRRAYEVTAVYELEDDSSIGEVHSGTPRPLGGDPDG